MVENGDNLHIIIKPAQLQSISVVTCPQHTLSKHGIAYKYNMCFEIQQFSILDTIMYAVAYLNHILTAASKVIWGQYKTYMSPGYFYEMEYPIHMYHLAMYETVMYS